MANLKASKIFLRYVEVYPNSPLAQGWNEWGEKYIESSGEFVRALYRGSILTAQFWATDESKERLSLLLEQFDNLGERREEHSLKKESEE